MPRTNAPTGPWKRLPRPVRWVAVTVTGVTLISVGAVLLVLPGPGLLLIAAGTAVLASEFAWAARLTDRGTSAARTVTARVRSAARRRTPRPDRPR